MPLSLTALLTPSTYQAALSAPHSFHLGQIQKLQCGGSLLKQFFVKNHLRPDKGNTVLRRSPCFLPLGFLRLSSRQVGYGLFGGREMDGTSNLLDSGFLNKNKLFLF